MIRVVVHVIHKLKSYKIMKNILISCLFAWFLVIQSLGIDGRAIGVIPVQDEVYCNKTIEALTHKSHVNVSYTCVDVGNI